MSRSRRCSECGMYGGHSQGCPEAPEPCEGCEGTGKVACGDCPHVGDRVDGKCLRDDECPPCPVCRGRDPEADYDAAMEARAEERAERRREGDYPD